MPRCCFKHDAFKREGYRHDGTDQCWMTDVGEFQINPGVSKYYCVFHAPKELQSSDRDDWPVDKRGEVQAKQLRELLDEWNKENTRRETKGEQTLVFLLPGLQCGNINLNEYSFSNSIIFDSATFSGYALFCLATFSGKAWFKSATFSEGAMFDSATFSEAAMFDSATFNGDTQFDFVTFSGKVQFDSARFRGNASFDSARFSKFTSLIMATFRSNAWFNSATFSYYAFFNSATFISKAIFKSATFKGYAGFDSATFNDDAQFDLATFSGNAWFNSATFNNNAEFISARFNRESIFINSKFNSGTNFSSCHFKQAPNFHGAILHQSTDFRGAEFPDRASHDAPMAYRTLKLAMGGVHSRQEEAMFYAMEQESRRNQSDTPGSIRKFSLLYHYLSDYGRNFIRPLVFLFCFTFVFLVVYAAVLSKTGRLLEQWRFALRFTIEQIVRPFSVWTEKGIKPLELLVSDGTVLTIQVIASVQSLLSIILITLSLLAIRREFKLG